MKLLPITTAIFFYDVIISVYSILVRPISTGWWVALACFFIGVLYLIRFASKKTLYVISGMKYIYEKILKMK